MKINIYTFLLTSPTVWFILLNLFKIKDWNGTHFDILIFFLLFTIDRLSFFSIGKRQGWFK